MGQAFRRAANRVVRTSTPHESPSSSSNIIKKNVDRPPPQQPPAAPKVVLKSKPIINQGEGEGAAATDPDQDISRTNPDNVLEEKDPGYDAMLSQMVGRIKTRPGGKLEMGEAFVVEKYDRPMPKLRNTSADSNYSGKPAPPGTLNVAQLRQILQLHQGKSIDHAGSMDVHQIAEKFRIDVTQVEKILRFISLPPEDSSSSSQQKN
ncbi:dynein beta chain, ciliary protein [Thalictrum thalictroides]|uniref:Dynein beta chain, ciliary protein n=1 Tax=Thalictrum thalictroides TaxID=46969 RepID=A0A7J6VJ56_THATH|nr:dynein beta chain, ciliary protein [Thalictrum thalictroides]